MKCDETRPRCLQCSRRGGQCQWDGDGASGRVLARQRIPLACDRCRTRKVGPTNHTPNILLTNTQAKCSGTGPGGKCERCRKLELPCEWTPRGPDNAPTPALERSTHHMPSPERTTSALINRAVLQDLARQYFATVHCESQRDGPPDRRQTTASTPLYTRLTSVPCLTETERPKNSAS